MNSDEEVRLTLRLSAALRDRLSAEAAKSGRSMNGEMVYRLEKTITDTDLVSEHETQLAELWQRIDKLEANVDELGRQVFPQRFDWK